MMASSCPQSGSSLLPLLDTLEDAAASQSEQTDAYLTIANRLSGDQGRLFLPSVEKHFARLGRSILGHVSDVSAELSQSALQALGFCVFHGHVASALSEDFAAEILSALCSLVSTSSDKNTCTRALWVISKQSFSSDMVAKKVPSILGTLESVWSREDVQSVVMEHEAVNVVIRLLEQVSAQMEQAAAVWVKLLLPLVVHSASKVRLRAAAALELGLPLLLRRQVEVAAVIEPMMSAKLIPELQKLFVSKNETNVLKLWPLLVKLLGKLLHRGGPFINSLLHLEELGFRSSSPSIKKIAFLAWKSLIDNFALNPDILCSTKRMKLLLQPLLSIHVRTEALLLTKVEVWWYLVVTLGPNLSSHFEQVCAPLLHSTVCSDSGSPSAASRSNTSVNGGVLPSTPKMGFSSTTSPSGRVLSFTSIQLLGLEMLLHLLLGPDVLQSAAKHKLLLSLEPLHHPLLSGATSFSKHSSVIVSHIRDGFISVGRDAPESLLSLIWSSLVRFVHITIESGGSKKGCEVLTLMLQALQSIVSSEALPAHRLLVLFEATVKGIPPRILCSASYQVGKMDVFNGTPALFLLLLLFNSNMLPSYMEDERFFICLQTLVGCGLSGPASPLAFAEAILSAVGRRASSLPNKEQLWRMWSAVVVPLTDTITQSNEVNQGDALEHNFSCVLSALMLPVSHLLSEAGLSQASQKSMLSSWSRLYRVFARCSSLVPTAEENVCCEELSAKMLASVDKQTLRLPVAAISLSNMLQVMVECVDFSPFSPHFQHKPKSPHTPSHWTRRRSSALGNLSSFMLLLLHSLQGHLHLSHATSQTTTSALVSILSALFSNLIIADALREALSALIQPLADLYRQEEGLQGNGKLEKLLGDLLASLQTRTSLVFDGDLLELLSPLLCVLFPHKHKPFRTAVAHFWNATFAKTLSLEYPEELRPILVQVKQTTPIILPGFEAVRVADDLQASSESSQMETTVSGIAVSLAGGKDSEAKARILSTMPRPVSMKLDFGSPKAPRRELEDEASVDFVFIPPENKERVLTEHQKEMKRTKRVDIPVMYNNLDASLDNTVFSQYTQSQEDTLHQLTGTSDPEDPAAEKVPPAESEVITKETQDYQSPREQNETQEPAEAPPQSGDVPMEEESQSKVQTQQVDPESTEDTSPNVSTSSDVVSGTPQKPNSRRQSFITLEKYPEGRSASPAAGGSSFTGPLVKSSSSDKQSTHEDMSASPAGPNSKESQSGANLSKPDHLIESPRRPKDCIAKPEPVKLTQRLPRDVNEKEDVIPDTQTTGQTKGSSGTPSVLEEVQSSSQEEDSDAGLDNSQLSQCQLSPDEPRRSGRNRIRPQIPGEDPEERESKHNHSKKRRSREVVSSEAQSPSSANIGPNTRSKQAAEESSNSGRLRTRSQGGNLDSSQNNSQGRTRRKTKLFSHSEDFLTLPERKRSAGDMESSRTDTACQLESNTKRRTLRKNEKSPEWREKDLDSDSKACSPPLRAAPQRKDNPERTSQSWAESQDGETVMDTSLEGSQKISESDLCLGSQELTPLSAQRRSRRSKALEAEDKSQPMDPRGILNNHQASPLEGRTRRSRVQEEMLKSPTEGSQALGIESDSSQGKTRYSRRRSNPADTSNVESSGSESSETKDGSSIKKRGRKPRVYLQSLLSLESKKENQEPEAEMQNTPTKSGSDPKEASEVQDLQSPESAQEPGDPHQEETEGPSEAEQMETDTTNTECALLEEGLTTKVEASESDTDGDQILEEVRDDLSPPAEELEVIASVDPEEDPKHSEMEKKPDDIATPPVDSPPQQTNQDLEPADVQEEPRSPHRENVPEELDAPHPEGHSSEMVTLDSPVKQKELEAVLAADVGQSPGGGRARGTWSPSASPSTSILKKGQKRSLEVDTPSPLVKSRRVSFANPIQHQEVADDIDRRSPAVRMASPRRSKGPQQKLLSTPTEREPGFSPRARNTPGSKSSKKSLISEMIGETGPVSTDCIYRPLLGCSAPVEAVLPQISSNMWCRGFGQLVRARNIRTVGDLSALTAADIKALPIRSPKLSNVRKALRTYEQQRKARGGDELRSLDEMERMASEVEERSAPQAVDEPLASVLVDDVCDKQTPDSEGEGPVEGAGPEVVLSEVESLSCRMTSEHLALCSPLQLMDVHEQLGALQRRVVLELQRRITTTTPSDAGL